MFTGCIKAMGKLVHRDIAEDHGNLVVVSDLAGTMKKGESIAVNGACLTVEEVNQSSEKIVFYTLQETLKRTSLGSLEIGTSLNIEQALSMGDRLDGHLLTGHVDYKCSVVSVDKMGKDTILGIQLPSEYRSFVIEKGSIAIDGISLTIVEVKREFFIVHIIPYTMAHTNLKNIEKDTQVNIETDIIGKYLLKSRTAKALL